MFNISKIESLINALEITQEAKDEVVDEIEYLKKKLEIQQFKQKRIQRDKLVVKNVLNSTIDELERNKDLVEKQITKLDKSYKELKKAYDELEKFSYIVSHDLKSPLQSIAGFTQLLEKNRLIQADDNSNKYMKYIVNGVKQMAITIDDLLAYAKVANEAQKVKFSLVDFNSIIEKVKILLKSIIEKENVSIEVIDVLPVIFAAESAILQLFQNLIGNAIKFKKDVPPIIKIMAQETLPNTWEFIVTDNGKGINDGFQKNAFKAFQREKNQNVPGSGLGLAICEKVVKMHRGKINLVSKLGEGTAFIFTINSGKEMSKYEKN